MQLQMVMVVVIHPQAILQPAILQQVTHRQAIHRQVIPQLEIHPREILLQATTHGEPE